MTYLRWSLLLNFKINCINFADAFLCSCNFNVISANIAFAKKKKKTSKKAISIIGIMKFK